MFSDRGPLARVVEGYEPREGQRQMAEAVASTLAAGGMLLAEAGTGTGKTLAYLVPAILSGRPVLVSTGTKNLQEQIFFKDLPLLQKALGVPFTATLMKGRGNYLCLHRWKTFRESFESLGSSGSFPFERSERHVFLPIIEAWLNTTDTGDRAELRDLPEDIGMWKDIAADADTCLGSECPEYDACFLTRMRRRAADSDVVIVNHHLLCADASVRQSAYGEVIPSCSTLIVDEAHQLEDVATQYFGYSASAFRVDDLVRDTERLFSASGKGAPDDGNGGRGFTPRQIDEIQRALARVSECSRIFFSGLALRVDCRAPLGAARGDPARVEWPGDAEQRRGAAPALQPAGGPETRVRYTADGLTDHHEEGAALVGALEELETALAPSAEGQGAPAQIGIERAEDGDGNQPPGGVVLLDVAEALAAVRRRAGELGRDIRFLLRAGDSDYVYYLEIRRSGRSANAARPFLRASPIDVSQIVRDALFDRMRAAVLTSATLAVDGSFEYVKGRLGLRQTEELRVASEFDYATQALLYLPRRLPSPRAPSFPEAAAREVIEILRRSHGRAFVLFTSYRIMRGVQRLLELALPYPILVQGTAPRTDLLERFRSTPNAVLLATSSFWQGVDVVGDALSCVIVDKLPFASPADPVTAARIDAVAARGGDAFADYQVPLAMLALQQGLGRLIRHRTDRGVLAILDPRLRTMGYGRRFLASLPPAPVTHDLDAVGRFFV